MTPFQEKTLRIEWVKALGTIGAIFIPLLIGAITLWFQTQNALQVKAAELVMQAPSPWVAQQRVKVLKDMFRWRLRGMEKSFKIDNFPGTKLHEMRIELIRLLAANPQQREFILEEWARQFPNDVEKFAIDAAGRRVEPAEDK